MDRPIRRRAPNGQRAICAAPACARRENTHGYCGAHWHRVQRGTDLRTPLRKMVHGDRCDREGCDRPYLTKGLCSLHYSRLQRGGDLSAPPRWIAKVGETRTSPGGYVLVKTQQGRLASNWEPQHRLVMEDHLGRALHQDETVHHISGDRADNRIENLELWSSRQPGGQRVADKLVWAREILQRYG